MASSAVQPPRKPVAPAIVTSTVPGRLQRGDADGSGDDEGEAEEHLAEADDLHRSDRPASADLLYADDGKQGGRTDDDAVVEDHGCRGKHHRGKVGDAGEVPLPDTIVQTGDLSAHVRNGGGGPRRADQPQSNG